MFECSLGRVVQFGGLCGRWAACGAAGYPLEIVALLNGSGGFLGAVAVVFGVPHGPVRVHAGDNDMDVVRVVLNNYPGVALQSHIGHVFISDLVPLSRTHYPVPWGGTQTDVMDRLGYVGSLIDDALHLARPSFPADISLLAQDTTDHFSTWMFSALLILPGMFILLTWSVQVRL